MKKKQRKSQTDTIRLLGSLCLQNNFSYGVNVTNTEEVIARFSGLAVGVSMRV